MLKANQKTQEEKIGSLEKAVKEQQTFSARADKDSRLNRLLIVGVPENENFEINNDVATTDREKAMLIIKTQE